MDHSVIPPSRRSRCITWHIIPSRLPHPVVENRRNYEAETRRHPFVQLGSWGIVGSRQCAESHELGYRERSAFSGAGFRIKLDEAYKPCVCGRPECAVDGTQWFRASSGREETGTGCSAQEELGSVV